MALDFEYGINTNNRFLHFLDHDEEPEEFIAKITQPEQKSKKSTKERRPITVTLTKETANAKAAHSNTTKTSKENRTGKSATTEQTEPQPSFFGENNNQQTRFSSGRGGRIFSRGSGSANQDRSTFESSYRGDGQQRSRRSDKFQEQQASGETSRFEQSENTWENETRNVDQRSSDYYDRGHPRRGNFGGGRRSVRVRARGGRANFGNRTFDEDTQEQQQTQESSGWEENSRLNYADAGSRSARNADNDVVTNVLLKEGSIESDYIKRGGRGPFRPRVFHNNRNYRGARRNQYGNEWDQSGYEDYRHRRRQSDRQPRTCTSTVKSTEKKDGEGAYNWGNPTENPEEHRTADEITDTTSQAVPGLKDWAKLVDEAEKQMTYDEYKKQLNAKKQVQKEKIPQFNRRAAGEGEDLRNWQNFQHKYQKKNDDDKSDEIEYESGTEENTDGDELPEESAGVKKKLITIPLYFKPIEISRGTNISRGGQRRSGHYRDRPSESAPERSASLKQQKSQLSQETGEYQDDKQQPSSYHGFSRQRPGRPEYRRSYRNSTRGLGGRSNNRPSVDPRTLNLDDIVAFPTLTKE